MRRNGRMGPRGSASPVVPAMAVVSAVVVGLGWADTRPLEAQIAPFTYELRAGTSVPIGGFADDPEEQWAGEVDAGYSFGMSFAYAFRWYLAGYGGFSQHRFGCRAERCGRDTDLTGTGFDGGIRWILGSGRVIPLLRTGLVTYRIEGLTPGEVSEGGAGGDARRVVSHRNIGVEAGASLVVRMSQRIVLTPGLRYLRMNADFGPVGNLPIETMIADVGLMLAF